MANIPYVIRRPQQRFGSSRLLISKQCEQAAGGIMAKVSAGWWRAPPYVFKAHRFTFGCLKYIDNVYSPPSFTAIPSAVHLLPLPRR